ncbi:exonuclease domain-containing protein [Sulfurimonas sp.]|nr:exonuclease domain-containing protein [Sulfurimonas sp.]
MLIFLDIETTGLEDIDKICSIGIVYKDNDKTQELYECINEGKKISAKASSVNHITNEMLKGKPLLKESEAYKFLKEHNKSGTTFVVHDFSFISKMFSTCNFVFKADVVDTKRCTKHLIRECEEYSLNFLRYELKLYKELQEYRNTSLFDAQNVRLLYNYLLDMQNNDELVDLSSKNVLLEKFDFGKYNGKYIEDVAINDRGYLEWMLHNLMDLDDDFRYSIEYYLGESI